MRHEERKEAQAVSPEADDQDRREAQYGEHARDAEMACGGEGVQTGNDGNRNQAEQVGHKDEGEQREDEREVALSLRPEIHLDHVVDEARQTFHGHLPATRDDFPFHPQQHEEEDQSERDEHPYGAVCEADIDPPDVQRDQRLDRELMHRVKYGFSRHVVHLRSRWWKPYVAGDERL